MARKTDDLADSFATEESGGWLTRLLADEDPLDSQEKWRLGSWAAASLGAVVIAIMAVQNVTDRRRDQTVAADVAQQSQMVQRLAKDTQTATSRLTAAIESLNSDRDRLFARVGSLEQGLDSVTGSIARVQAGATRPHAGSDKPADRAAAAPLPEIPPKEPAPIAPTVAAVEAKPNVASPPPRKLGAIEPPASAITPVTVAVQSEAVPLPQAKPDEAPAAPAHGSSAPTAEAKKPTEDKAVAEKSQDKPRHDRVRLEPAPAEKPTVQNATAAMISSTPLMPSRSILAPPDPGAARLQEAKAATPEPAEEPEAAEETPAPRTEFGVDLGTANTVEGLRGLWPKLSKTQKALKGLQPIIMIKENGNATQLRLVAGPIADAAAAAKVCAALGSADRGCEASVYDGQRLPMIAPAATPQQAPQRPVRRTRERVTLQTPEPPPPPAPPQEPPPQRQSTLSSILGIR